MAREFKIGADMIVPMVIAKESPDEARMYAEKMIANLIAAELVERNLIHIEENDEVLASMGDALFRGYVVVME